MNYNLHCHIILGAELSNFSVTFNWTKTTSSGDLIDVEGSSSNLSFSLLSMSDAGNYSCIENNLSLTNSSELTIKCKEYIIFAHPRLLTCNHIFFTHYVVPAPEGITITSSQPSPIKLVGLDITLTCTANLSSSVDVPASVTFLIRGPSGTIVNERVQVSTDSTTAALNTLINSFTSSQSGLYNCTAFLGSRSSLHLDSLEGVSESIVITTGT